MSGETTDVRCNERRYFHRIPGVAGIPGSRAAVAYCDRPAGHSGAHQGIGGTTAYCWCDDEPVSGSREGAETR